MGDIMEEKNVIKLMDEDGKKIEFEVVEELSIDEKDYLLLASLENEDEDAFPVRVEENEGEKEYFFIEDDEEYERIKRAYDKTFE